VDKKLESTITSNPYRLPRTVVPSAYRLRIDVDLDGATFAGSVAIDVEITEEVTTFALNAIELVVSAVTVRSDGQPMISQPAVLDDQFETATFGFDATLPLGLATISLDFTGTLNDHLRGFYRSTFTDVDGATHVIATTQFASTDARRAFPCWDDPAFKATYQVILVVPEDAAAFSNTTEISSRSLGQDRQEVCFAETMVMSTYLVAFVVGPFEASPVTMVDGIPVRIVYPIGKGHLVEWAMELAVHALEFFGDYFAIAYPGDKVDLVAIPDFAQGAMENLGCVTFRETELLVDPAKASHAELERVALVINHELAHMWFGDLVTMDWWQGIWLNEAFATFMESLCTDHFRPEWKKWVGFNPSRDAAFTVDGQHSTRAIEYEVISPDECAGMFDILTYIKGCAVLRMLEQYLGATTFRDGIRIYLQRHAYANTVTADLWTALEAASSLPVGDIMDTWILQGGFPLLTVDGDTVSQAPFTYTEAVGESNIGSNWKVPILVRSLDGGATSAHLLEGPSMAITMEGVSVMNAGGSGFYRTAYATDHLTAVAARLVELDELERAVLFSDTWASILVGHSTFKDLFILAKGLIDLDEPATWNVVVRATDMANRIGDEAAREVLAQVVQRLCGPVLARLGWEAVSGEPSQAGELRAIVVGVLGAVGHDQAVIAEATARFDAGSVSGDLANAIVSITMLQNRPGDVVICEQRREAAANPQDEQRYLFAPAGSSDPAVLLDVFKRSFSTIRTQDAPYLIGAMVRSRVAGWQIWKAMTERWSEAIERFPAGSPVAMAAGLSTFVADPARAVEIRRFHESNPLEIGQQQVAQVLDVMDLHVALAKRNAPSLENELRQVLVGD
jgi:puromycin-sensitive aminopeptidase